ncbi:hypothetical protein AVEN_22275-1 [Araneus ventricosus]|uniref:Uncharacterized protein n=1 Tax=Araneus ventricosus TaxID=182803 RepID=A0A4Y2HU68_ARAVE|nr:hypothetical protein AVEN_22275-1 [Araneus ventricosus]
MTYIPPHEKSSTFTSTLARSENSFFWSTYAFVQRQQMNNIVFLSFARLIMFSRWLLHGRNSRIWNTEEEKEKLDPITDTLSMLRKQIWTEKEN